ncbi:hypothetical protein GQ44DRAFT_670810 [Phaeosphaeriaceae sp. PMI808]|nr:hypothetical protein GQ44DRAFT_670810 [Phaeosphaeriaceae sp. PMI808]
MLRSRLFRATTRSWHLPARRPYAAHPKPLQTSQTRIERFNRQLPRFLHKYTSALANAPLSHITSFLILHELTAVIPLFSLAAYFHYTHWLPSWFAEGAFVLNGVERFGRYFKRKGWIRSGEAEEAEREVQQIQHEDQNGSSELRKADKAWNISEGGVRLVVEFATAYAITKALLIPRIMFSVWATPWFARMTVVPLIGRFKSIFSRGKSRTPASGAGTGAIERGAPMWSYFCLLAFCFRYTTQQRTRNMCFDDRHTYRTRTTIRSGARVSEEYTVPRRGMTWRRRNGMGGSYYPSRYYGRPPSGRHMSTALMRHPIQPRSYSYQGHSGAGRSGFSSSYGRYLPGARVPLPHQTATAYPKPRHQYIYTPRYGQRGYLSYVGQTPNGAMPTGVIPNGGVGYGYGGVGVGIGAAAVGHQPGVYATHPHQPYYGGHANYCTQNYYPTYSPTYSGYYNAGLYGSMYPLANFYHPYQRTYYNTAPSYGYSTQAYVYPPGPGATTTTTYRVTNSHASAAAYATSNCAHACAHGVSPRAPACQHSTTREDIQMENRRIATERGAYTARRIKPADARDDDPFWCRERNGEWHLRSFYQIENECHPGRWLMDAEMGFLVFNRD